MRSLSSHHISSSNLRPIGLSKSDDQILNSVCDSSHEDEDCLDSYIEGQQTEDLAKELVTLHISAEDNLMRCQHDSPYLAHKKGRRVAHRGMSVDARISEWFSVYDPPKNNNDEKQRHLRGSGYKTSSILALHHTNVGRRPHQQISSLCSPQLQHVMRDYNNQNAQDSSSSISSSPRLSHSSNSSPRVYHSSATPSPRLIREKNCAPKLVKSNVSSPKLLHSDNLAQSQGVHPSKFYRTYTPVHKTLKQAHFAAQIHSSCDSGSDVSVVSNVVDYISKGPSIKDPPPSCYGNLKKQTSCHNSREMERTKNLAKMKPLELHTPPGTAPLPVKFIKKTPLTDRSPSSWFCPPRQTSLPISNKNAPVPSNNTVSANTNCFPSKMCGKKKSVEGVGGGNGSSREGSQTNSLNSSMEVLLDNASQLGRRDLTGTTKSSSFSWESVMSGGSRSSMESLKSSMSEGSKNIEGAQGEGSSWRHMGSNSSLPLRPSLLLPAPHRSLIQVCILIAIFE